MRRSSRLPGGPLLCLALDALDTSRAEDIAGQVGGAVDVVKVGLGLYARGGPATVRRLRGIAGRVFLDLKLHDIPSQVADAVGVAADLGVDFLTLHISGGLAMLEAAAAARDARGASLRLLGVTVLTSLGPRDLSDTGADPSLGDLVLRRACLALRAPLDGIVCSAADLDRLTPHDDLRPLLRITPGIRPAAGLRSAAQPDDQRRVLDPAEAVRRGSDMLVVGRPIVRADDPRAAAKKIRAAMEGRAS